MGQDYQPGLQVEALQITGAARANLLEHLPAYWRLSRFLTMLTRNLPYVGESTANK